MKKALTLLIVFIALGSQAFGQYNANQNKVWAFGERGGINFSTGSPVPFLTNIHTSEGCASVSDAMGRLLFYTDGDTVFTRSGAPMPNGKAIVPYLTYSATQAAVIVQVPGKGAQYYVFSLEQENGSIGYCHLGYCIVDMTLNGGNGDVIASTKYTYVGMNFSEKMVAVLGNSGDIWLIVHQLNAATFFAYQITATGFSTAPVVSNAGTFQDYLGGVLRVSPDRTKIACLIEPYYTATPHSNGCEIFDFNATTGIVSNCQVLDTLNEQYGAEFSPDNTRLYVHEESGTGAVYQYDVSLPHTADIIASKTLIHTGGYYKDLKLGPDNKIYLSNVTNTGLDCISNPNALGTACSYNANEISLSSSAMSAIGLPNVAVGQWTPDPESIPVIGSGIAFSLFPNPAKDEITIHAAGLAGNFVTVSCYNTLGTLVTQKIIAADNGSLDITLNLAALPKGIYSITLFDESGTSSAHRVVLE